MTDISRKKFVRLLAAGVGSISTLFLTGFVNLNKLINAAVPSGNISPATGLPDSTITDLPSVATIDPIIEPTIEYALEQFDSGYN